MVSMLSAVPIRAFRPKATCILSALKASKRREVTKMEPDPNNQVPPVEQPMSQPLPDDDQAVFPAQPAPDIKKTFTPEPLDI